MSEFLDCRKAGERRDPLLNFQVHVSGDRFLREDGEPIAENKIIGTGAELDVDAAGGHLSRVIPEAAGVAVGAVLVGNPHLYVVTTAAGAKITDDPAGRAGGHDEGAPL